MGRGESHRVLNDSSGGEMGQGESRLMCVREEPGVGVGNSPGPYETSGIGSEMSDKMREIEEVGSKTRVGLKAIDISLERKETMLKERTYENEHCLRYQGLRRAVGHLAAGEKWTTGEPKMSLRVLQLNIY